VSLYVELALQASNLSLSGCTLMPRGWTYGLGNAVPPLLPPHTLLAALTSHSHRVLSGTRLRLVFTPVLQFF